jgi:hypothetical protein
MVEVQVIHMLHTMNCQMWQIMNVDRLELLRQHVEIERHVENKMIS